MSALVDHWNDEKKLPPNERIVAVARWFLGTPYNQKSARDAQPLDGVGSRPLRFTDCSGFVRSVFAEVFPGKGLTIHSQLSTHTFQQHPLWRTLVEPPRAGDVIVWPAHMGIVVDPNKKVLIHAPGQGKPVRYQDWTFMPPVVMFRRWCFL